MSGAQREAVEVYAGARSDLIVCKAVKDTRQEDVHKRISTIVASYGQGKYGTIE
jgi:hypothetical protein